MAELVEAQVDDTKQLPPGLHVSWPAVAIILSALGLMVALADRVRSQDMRLIETRMESIQAEVTLGREDRIRSQVQIAGALAEQNRLWDLRLSRIEASILEIAGK
jgi:hypothetical protein